LINDTLVNGVDQKLL